jgi:large conductance mechanosensitive channel
MSILSEFQQFIQRGSVVDLAVGVIMGSAFTKIVNSLVADVIMPPIGYLIGGIKFTELKYELPQFAIPVPDPTHPGEFVQKTLPAASINYGNFLQTTFDFLVIAACVFLLVKGMNALHRKKASEPAKPADLSTSEKLLTEIRDAIQAKQ